MENCISYIGWRRPNNPGAGKWFRLLRWTYSAFSNVNFRPSVSKFSEYILFKRRKFPTFRNFPIIFPFKRWKCPTFCNFPILVPIQRMEFPNIWDGHFRFFPMEMRWENYTARDGLDPAISGILLASKFSDKLSEFPNKDKGWCFPSDTRDYHPSA